MLAASQRGCTINATDCMYSKPPSADEQLIYSKNVEDIYWNKLRTKVHLVGSYYAKVITSILMGFTVHDSNYAVHCYTFIALDSCF